MEILIKFYVNIELGGNFNKTGFKSTEYRILWKIFRLWADSQIARSLLRSSPWSWWVEEKDNVEMEEEEKGQQGFHNKRTGKIKWENMARYLDHCWDCRKCSKSWINTNYHCLLLHKFIDYHDGHDLCLPWPIYAKILHYFCT